MSLALPLPRLALRLPAWWTACLALLFAGCAPIVLVSSYDEGLDHGVTAVQRSVETFLIDIEHNGRAPAAKLSVADQAFFDQVEVDLSSLRVRASATPKNELTTQMLETLSQQMQTLQKLVRVGISPEQVRPIREAVNTSVRAILTFELAKKRGETNPK